MLLTLRVKNLAIVENVRVEFQPGLNVITGETGAGKSILVGALGLVLGERADRAMIRAGEEQCGVEAVFQLADPAAVNAALDELGLERCEDGRLIVRRIVSGAGGGKNLLNDCPTTVQALKRVGDLLVDMHGPHDHQSLLRPEFQLDLLDAFGHLAAPRAAYEALHAERLEIDRARRELDGDDQDVGQQIDLLAFQVREIEEAALRPEDETELEQEHRTAANAQRVLELAGALCAALTEGEGSAFDRVVAAQQALGGLRGLMGDADAWKREAESIAVQIQGLCESVERAAQGVDGDPERLRLLEDRMGMLHKLKRKYGASVAEILAFLERARERLAGLQSRGERIAELERKMGEVGARREAAGRELSRRRKAAAGNLGAAVTAEIRDLGFEHGEFAVGVKESAPGPRGMDEVEFGFAPNVGEPMRPLSAIASSGEISRVMLATKAVLAAHDRIPVLVFDEIDANVGGEMGQAIGAKLRAVCAGHQVICITHLPQVAVHGTTHYVVTKSVSDGRTRTDIGPVAREAREAEIARMLGGRDLSGAARRHARDMLKRDA